MLRSALLVAALLSSTFPALAAEKTPDPHFRAARTSAIARISVFAHGYLHGYEGGFHLADLDLQMGRAARDIRKCREAKSGDSYRREFGDKHSFERGYREGLRVGYADGMAGRAFRAVDELEAAGPVAPDSAPIAADAAFDEAFSLGYLEGQKRGLQDGRRDAGVTPLPPCPATAEHPTDQQSFCTAYGGGFRVGYSDGLVNVGRTVAAQFEARAGK